MSKRSVQIKGKPQISKILIKKYSNRRLYDVTHSQYLTLDELVELIKAGCEVQVTDSKTKQDITQSVLTQVFLEHKGSYLFSTSFLHQMIRNQDGILGEFFTDVVPKFLESYLEMRDSIKRQISSLTAPIIAPQNWLSSTKKDLKKNLLTPFHSLLEDGADKFTSDTNEAFLETPPKLSRDDVVILKEKIKELEDRLDELGN
ncbi:polyhydroxyalkanoate synthesis regulator DNA-binding domain-containing protein [Deltaproteobacteria bacterium TL4]